MQRFTEVSYSVDGLWDETGITDDECNVWIAEQKKNIEEIHVYKYLNSLCPIKPNTLNNNCIREKGILDLHVRLTDGKTHVVRVLFPDFKGKETVDLNTKAQYLDTYGNDFLNDLFDDLDVPIKKEEPVISKEYTDKPTT